MFFIKKVVVYLLSITSLLLIHNVLMAKTPVAILYDDIFLEHNTGSGHPERPERLHDIIDTLRNNPDFKYDLVWPKVRKASNSEIALAHSEKYIQLVESLKLKLLRLSFLKFFLRCFQIFYRQTHT